MDFFDFHHHHPNKKGIYNLHFSEGIRPELYSVGLHPMDIDENWEKHWERIQEISQHPNCVAIGECGLDALVQTDLKRQKEIFKQHILWANKIQKPVIIHCVRLFSELLAFSKIAKTPLIVHGFNKKESIAQSLLEKGFYLSFGKASLHRLSLQKNLREIPLDKLFLETDDDHFNIQMLYEKVAEIKNISVHQLQKAIDYNQQKITNG